MELSPKQKSFCENYAASGNAADAARQAGYSAKYANRQAAQLLKIPRVVEYIDKLAVDAAAVRFTTIDERRELLTKLARAPFDNDGLRSGASHFEINAAIRAIDLLNKMDGVYLQKVEVAANAAPVVLRWEDNLAETVAAARERVANAEKGGDDGGAVDSQN